MIQKRSTFFRRFSLLQKLVACFLMVATVIAFVGVSAIYFSQRTISEFDQIATKNLPSSVISTNMRGIAKDLRAMVFRVGFADNSQEELDAVAEKIKDLSVQYEDNNREYRALSLIEGEKEILEKTENVWKEWLRVGQLCLDARLKQTPEGIAAYMSLVRNEFRENGNSYFEAINELVIFHQEHARMAQEHAEQSDRMGKIVMAGLIGFGTLLALLIGIIFGKKLAQVLNSITVQISNSSNNVGGASQQLSTASQQLAEGSAQAASSLQETVASIEELSSMVQMNATNAQEAALLSQESQKTAQTGEGEIQQLIQAISDVSKSSRQIEEIINVIDDIAFQTNLLALNAAVEAARAGEQGKGFAVVAEAVRSLAQRSAIAAKDISGLIRDSVAKIEKGTEYADRSGQVLKSIVESVAKVSLLNTEVASASREQSEGLIQISAAVNSLDQGTHKNATSAEEAASASEEMSAQASSLGEMVSELTEVVQGSSRTSSSGNSGRFSKERKIGQMQKSEEQTKSKKIS